MGAEKLELSPLLARRELWLLASVAAVDPYHRQRFALLEDRAFRQRTVAAAALLAAENPALVLGPGEVAPEEVSPAALFAAFDADCAGIEATYRQIFGLTAVAPQCPACEIEYEPNADIAYRTQQMADIGGFYNAFGLRASTQAGERLDHIVVEAEFMYVLLAKEAAALEAGNEEAVQVCREARRKFFQEHVGWWLPAYARLLARVAPDGYYRHVARLIGGISALERVSLGLAPFPARIIPKPSALEDDWCFECLGG